MERPEGKSTRRRRSKPKRPILALRLLSFVFKLLLLVVVAGLSWVGGVAMALRSPSSSPRMPMAVRLLGFYEGLASPSLPLGEEVPVFEFPAAPRVELTEAERSRLQAELGLLQEELNALVGRAAALEVEVGISRPTKGLEGRLEFLAELLAAPPPEGRGFGEMVRPVFSRDGLMVILPSDVLFEGDGYSLRPGAGPILDVLIADLRGYKDVDVRVGAHTDDVGGSGENADLSFLMAEAVAEYLSRGLGDRYYWIVVGYGESRPLTDNQTDVDRQRNRRVEIKIIP